MLAALFLRISHCVCEPLAVGALIGMTGFLCRHWRRSRSETLLIAGLLLFVIGWRTVMPILADRYAFFLVPAAIFFTVYGVKEVAGLCRRLLPGVPWHFLWAAGLLITVACISLLHTNEDRAFFALLDIFRREIRDVQSPVILWSDHDFSAFLESRVRFRLTKEPDRIRRDLNMTDASEYLLFRFSRRGFRAIENLPDRKLIAKVDGGGRRKFIYGLWKKTRCFQRLDGPAGIEEHTAPESGNLFANAGFETVRPQQETAALARHYVALGADFYRKPGWKLPVAWNPIMLPGKSGLVQPEFEASAEAPIRGKYSLRIKVFPEYAREISFPKPLSAGDYCWSLLVRAKKDVRFRLFFHVFRNKRYFTDCNIVSCTIPAAGTYFVSVPVYRSDMTKGDYYTAAIGGLGGEFFVDEVSLVPLSNAAER